MDSKEAMLEQIRTILWELFEIDPAQVTPQTDLYDDLDIDSIDAVDMAVRLNQLTGRKIQAADFKDLRTIGDVVDTLQTLLHPAPQAS